MTMTACVTTLTQILQGSALSARVAHNYNRWKYFNRWQKNAWNTKIRMRKNFLYNIFCVGTKNYLKNRKQHSRLCNTQCVCLIAWFLSVSSADDECICWVTVASFAILTCPWHGCNLHLFKCKQYSLQQLSTQQITFLCILCLSVDIIWI